jgi:exoribonuclease R
MLRMNSECAKLLQAKQRGIYRSAAKTETKTDILDLELKRIVQSVAGEYCSYANRKPHEWIGTGLANYVHITSPIRRVVDMVNMLELLADLFPWSADAKVFQKKWQVESRLLLLNRNTKAIRKLQTELELLDTFEKNPERTYMGFIFERTQVEPQLYKYKVYLAETKWLTSVYSPKELKNNTTVYVSAHLFLDEAKMTKKIRLQMV